MDSVAQANKPIYIEVLSGDHQGARGVLMNRTTCIRNNATNKKIYCILFKDEHVYEYNTPPKLEYRQIRPYESLERGDSGKVSESNVTH
jgi:hypothetical protein